MRLIHPRLAEWLRNDPRAPNARGDSYLLERKAELRTVFDGDKKLTHYVLRLIGGGADDRRLTCMANLPEQSSGISGGGSAPDPIEAAVNHWCHTAGYPDEVKGGAR